METSSHLKFLAVVAIAAAMGFLMGHGSVPANAPDTQCIPCASPTPTAARSGTMLGMRTETLPPVTATPTPDSRALNDAVQSALEETSSRLRLRELRKALFGIDPTQIPAVLESLKSRSGAPELFTVQLELLDQWAVNDPRAALKFAENYDSSHRSGAIEAVVRSWAENDEATAQAWIRTLPSGPEKRDAQSAFLSALTERSPTRAIALLQTGTVSDSEWQRVFSTFASDDPAGAALAAIALPPGLSRNRAVQAVALEWSRNDAATAAAWVKGLPAAVRNPVLQSVAWNLAATDPEGALSLAMSAPAGYERANAVSSAVTRWAETDRTAAMAWIEHLPESVTRRQALSNIVGQWGETDPTTALQFVSSLTEASSRNQLISRVLTSWTNWDTNAAMQWLNQNSKIAGNSEAIGDMVSTLTYRNPEKALVVAGYLPSGELMDGYYRNIGNVWAQNDPAAAAAYVAGMQPGSSRDTLLRGVVAGTASNDPIAATRMLNELPAGSTRENATFEVAQIWAQSNPGAAIAWISQSASSVARDNALGSIVAQWAQNDSSSASAWLQTQPNSASKDVAVQRFASAIQQYYPENALAWAESIGDDTARHTTVDSVIHDWLRRDSAAARTWIENSSEPQDWKTRMMK